MNTRVICHFSNDGGYDELNLWLDEYVQFDSESCWANLEELGRDIESGRYDKKDIDCVFDQTSAGQYFQGCEGDV